MIVRVDDENSGAAVPSRVWKPGQPLPPHSHLPKARELRKYIKERYGDDGAVLVDRLHEIAFDLPHVPMKVRVDCVKELLDRGWGRPAQSIAVSTDVPLFALPGDTTISVPDLGNDEVLEADFQSGESNE